MALTCTQRKSTRHVTPSSSIINRATSMVTPEIVTEDKRGIKVAIDGKETVDSRRPRWGCCSPSWLVIYTYTRALKRL
jgi:hypothetical protein